MTSLHAWIAAQNAKHCDLCGVSLFLNFIQICLIVCLHWGG
jgi:hypothetical protein